MKHDFLSRNLESLKKIDRSLHEKAESFQVSSSYQITKSKSGYPTLSWIDSKGGDKKQITSVYDPVSEASRFLESFNIRESLNFIVLGFGLGYQIKEIVKNASRMAKIYIFEKDWELFALSMREVDLTEIFEHPGVKLFVDIDPCNIKSLIEPELINFTLIDYCLIGQKALLDRNAAYYGKLSKEIDSIFKESQINLKTQSIHSRLYYKNIFSNIENLLNSPGVTSLKDSLSGTPTIGCAAGPSLDKNIQLLKTARKNFFLIAVATALKPLLHNGIQPDVVFSIDPDDLTINSFDFLNESGKYWLVYNPAVPKAITDEFPGSRLAFDSQVFLAEWFIRETGGKGGLGKVTSVAHSAVQFAQYLGCSPIIMVGQDLSFSKQRLHCNQSFYFIEMLDKVARLEQLSYWNNSKYLNFGKNLVEREDLFGCIIKSTLAMDSYNHIFSQIVGNTATVINATEGGMPIDGIRNLTLREVLYNYCRSPIDKNRKNISGAVKLKRDSFGSLKDSVLAQTRNLEEVAKKLEGIEKNYLNIKPLNAEVKQLFITEMENLYNVISGKKETALLLQGYDFSGFTDWYRVNSEILRKKDLYENYHALEEEFERDIKFFEVLVESVNYLKVNFKKSIAFL